MILSNNVSRGRIILQVIFSLVIVLFFWEQNRYVSYWIIELFSPLKLYTTAIHEAWHAIVCIMTGGEVGKISLSLDTSGFTLTRGGIFILISPAGYIGSALTGALLIISAKNTLLSKILLLLVCSVIVGLNIIYIDSYLSIAFLNSIIISLGLIYFIFQNYDTTNISIFLGTILAVDSFEDIKKIVLYMSDTSDAGILARYFGIPYLSLPIAIIFSMISMYIWYRSIKYLLNN